MRYYANPHITVQGWGYVYGELRSASLAGNTLTIVSESFRWPEFFTECFNLEK